MEITVDNLPAATQHLDIERVAVHFDDVSATLTAGACTARACVRACVYQDVYVCVKISCVHVFLLKHIWSYMRASKLTHPVSPTHSGALEGQAIGDKGLDSRH